MASVQPIYDPGQKITGRATGAAVSRGRILTVAGVKTNGGNVLVRHCGATDPAIGAAEYDAAQDACTSVMRNGTVTPIEAGGTVTAGRPVEVMAGGRVQNLNTGVKVGTAVESGASGEFPLVDLNY